MPFLLAVSLRSCYLLLNQTVDFESTIKLCSQCQCDIILFFFIRTVNCQSCFNVQFVCGDGECLNRNNDDNGVCDSKVDCSDGSDESRCGSGPGKPVEPLG